ncbi:hypothetical protein G7Z17_g7165 [Cylindrodendrum hubeiense]|uniref:Uncharacterized protein n=1 Tax=Cylindrodendrum hubeiense TaxID=595255 RepID=A0A9P5LFK4_9HYPO|nr:hypothetical protein G7Z17_g7165 [Cylindrodendrum hubeiense]
MAASSVDLPPQPDEEATPPAMLDRARGLASAIGVAAAAVAGHHHVLGDVMGRGGEGVAGQIARDGNRGDDQDGEETEEMEGIISEALTAVPTTATTSESESTDAGCGRALPPKGIGLQGRSALSPSRPSRPDNISPSAGDNHSAHAGGEDHQNPAPPNRVSFNDKPGGSCRSSNRDVQGRKTSASSSGAVIVGGFNRLAQDHDPAGINSASNDGGVDARRRRDCDHRRCWAFVLVGILIGIVSEKHRCRLLKALLRTLEYDCRRHRRRSRQGLSRTLLLGPEPVPLPSRFARIKRNLIRGHEAELEASWTRLLTALLAEVDHIEVLGAHLIPSIEFAEIEDPTQSTRFGRDLRRYGVGVIRKVVPKADADVALQETVEYLNSKSHIKTQQHDPACFDFFWTPAQVRARAHHGVLSAQRFMMNLWETSPEDRLVTRLPITYVDRLRVHGAGQSLPHDLNVPPLEPPQSADDWINALESSAGIIAQVDNGSLERWEPDGYQHAGTYNHVFHGRWEDHDPWECASRVSATMDLYNGYGACTIFRMFQGVLALSTVEPGMVRLLPSPKLATAYYLLRPFFSTRKPPPESRSGPEWDAYLDPSNWKLEREPDTIIHGAVPGHAQRITEHWHPHLHLRGSMITLPTLQPGDYVFWHPDLPYYLSSNNYGLKTPSGDNENVSMLVYVPAAPLTQTNALYLARQRKAFQRGHPGPDFDSTGRGTVMEDAETRPGEKEIAEMGGPAALQAMGLAPWEVAGTRAGTPPSDRVKPKDEDVEMEAEAETKSLMSSSSGSHAEAEVVRLANIILFPDRSMLGYSV